MTFITSNIPDNYEDFNSFEVIFCPNCGALNHIFYNWYGGIKGLIFCAVCGQEL